MIQLVDLDGVFIDSSKVVKSNELKYEEDRILANNPQEIIDRNNRKSQILNRLITLPKVWKIVDYKVYFFSCNLDHIIHNERNLDDNLKYDYSSQFAIQYKDDIKGFIEFFSNQSFSLHGEYSETWKFVKQDENSLKRFTNFNLLFES